MDYAKVSLEKHYEWQGKIEIKARVPADSKEALSLAYTPGVAQPCLEIEKDVNKSYALTRRWNTVAVVTDGTAVLGVRIRSEVNPDTDIRTVQFKTGNRELDPARQDFHWYPAKEIREITWPEDVFVVERLENGNFYGILQEVNAPNLDVPAGGVLKDRFLAALDAARLGGVKAELAARGYVASDDAVLERRATRLLQPPTAPRL